ncbi:DUF1080 domain-containing protein [Puteibacter caeruleilacunae]|nr:DUF1080 domain-containing protein [Puteibacter caeruleilacunae]
MKYLFKAAQFFLLVVIMMSCSTSASKYKKGKWVQLFNGKNLEGWTPKITGYDCGENYGNTFRVEDGLLKVSYDQYDKFDARFGHLFYKDKFSHYLLAVEYRFKGDQVAGGAGWAYRNSGIMIHGQSPESMTKKQYFPVSIEVQLLGGDGVNERTNANVCTPGTHIEMNGELIERHCNNSTSKTCHNDEWVRVEVEVRGNKVIKHFVDGVMVMEYNKPQLDDKDPSFAKLAKDGEKMLSEGTISLQSESAPLEFRKVEIMVLE